MSSVPSSHTSSVVLDGGLATALESAGHDLSTNLWSARLLASNPDAIRDAHLAYYLAGAQVAITASYQASVPGLRENLGLSHEDALALIQTSVRLAIEARDMAGEQGRELLVAGSVGPYGAYLANGAEYTGDYAGVTEDALREFHHDRIAALLDAGADLLACETIPSLLEAKVLCELLTSDFPAAKAWMSFTLRDSTHLSDETEMQEVLRFISACPRVVAVGYNCIPLDLATPALQHLSSLIKLPLVMYPNSGEQWNAAEKKWYATANNRTSLRDTVRSWQQLGAVYIGGCCRMGVDDIKVIADGLRSK